MKRLLLWFAFMLVLASCSKAEVSKAPGFELRDLDGKIVKLSDYSGKVVIVNFWATWCPPCRAELPEFVRFYNENKKKGVEIIGIALSSRKADVDAMVKEYGMSYPVCLSDGKAEAAYGGIRAIPTTFIIDRKGNISTSRKGMMGYKDLEEAVKKLL